MPRRVCNLYLSVGQNRILEALQDESCDIQNFVANNRIKYNDFQSLLVKLEQEEALDDFFRPRLQIFIKALIEKNPTVIKDTIGNTSYRSLLVALCRNGLFESSLLFLDLPFNVEAVKDEDNNNIIQLLTKLWSQIISTENGAKLGKVIDKLLESNANVDHLNRFGSSAYKYSMDTKFVPALVKFLAYTEQLEYVDRMGNNIMHILLVKYVNHEFVKQLPKNIPVILNNYFLFERLNKFLKTPLHYLSTGFPISLLDNILSKIDSKIFSVKDYNGDTILNTILQNYYIPSQNLNIIKMIIEKSELVLDVRNEDKQTAVNLIFEYDNLQVLNLLPTDFLQSYKDIEDGNTILHLMAKSSYFCLEVLKKLGSLIHINTLNDKGNTAYFEAVKELNEEFIKNFSVQYENHLNYVNEQGQNAVHLCAQSNKQCVKILRLLDNAGVDVHATDVFRNPPIHYCVLHGTLANLQFLLDRSLNWSVFDQISDKELEIIMKDQEKWDFLVRYFSSQEFIKIKIPSVFEGITKSAQILDNERSQEIAKLKNIKIERRGNNKTLYEIMTMQRTQQMRWLLSPAFVYLHKCHEYFEGNFPHFTHFLRGIFSEAKFFSKNYSVVQEALGKILTHSITDDCIFMIIYKLNVSDWKNIVAASKIS